MGEQQSSSSDCRHLAAVFGPSACMHTLDELRAFSSQGSADVAANGVADYHDWAPDNLHDKFPQEAAPQMLGVGQRRLLRATIARQRGRKNLQHSGSWLSSQHSGADREIPVTCSSHLILSSGYMQPCHGLSTAHLMPICPCPEAYALGFLS